MSKKNKVDKKYRKDGTLLSKDDGKTITFYEDDGKTVSDLYIERDAEHIQHVSFKDGKITSEYSGEYTDAAYIKEVKSNYDDKGEFSHWDVKKYKEEWNVRVGDEINTSYKKDDIKAITSGDVSGVAYIDVHRTNLVGKNGDPIWVEQAKEKADKKITAKKTAKKNETAKALKVQKESQLVSSLKNSDNQLIQDGKFVWTETSKQKMATKTEQKAKSAKAKKATAQRTTNAKNDGRS